MLDTIPAILETKHWRVILSKDQEILGRCIVVCSETVGEMGQLTVDQWLDFGQVAKRLETAAKQAFGATMCNWTCLMNNAYQHEPPDPQVHWHFRPRYRQSVQCSGLEFTDQEFGSHYPRNTNREVGPGVMGNIFASYKRFLN